MWCVCAASINHVKRTQNKTFTSFTFVSQGALTGDCFPYYYLSLIFFSSEGRTDGLCNCLLKVSNRHIVTSPPSLVLLPLTQRPGKLRMFVSPATTPPPNPLFLGFQKDRCHLGSCGRTTATWHCRDPEVMAPVLRRSHQKPQTSLAAWEHPGGRPALTNCSIGMACLDKM